MSDLWNIYKDGRQIGPLSPSDVRRGLREGEFDPFDLVARDGSNLRRELVEVDELFFTSQVVYGQEMVPSTTQFNAQTQQVQRTQAPQQLSGSAAKPSATVSEAYGRGPERAEAPLLGRGHLALADQGGVTVPSLANPYRPQIVRRQRDPKHFLLMNKNGRVLGPMSATEVQSLYFRGVLTGDVMVMRLGAAAKVKISRFISVMSGNRSAKPQVQGAHPVSGMAAMIAGQHHQAGRSSALGMPPLAAMALVAALTLFLATGLLMFEHKTGRLSALVGRVSGSEEVGSRAKPKSLQRPRRAVPKATKKPNMPLSGANAALAPVPALTPAPVPTPVPPQTAAPASMPVADPEAARLAAQMAAQAAFIAEDLSAPIAAPPAAKAGLKAKAKVTPRSGSKPLPRPGAARRSQWQETKRKFKPLPRGH